MSDPSNSDLPMWKMQKLIIAATQDLRYLSTMSSSSSVSSSLVECKCNTELDIKLPKACAAFDLKSVIVLGMFVEEASSCYHLHRHLSEENCEKLFSFFQREPPLVAALYALIHTTYQALRDDQPVEEDVVKCLVTTLENFLESIFA